MSIPCTKPREQSPSVTTPYRLGPVRVGHENSVLQHEWLAGKSALLSRQFFN